MPKKTATKTPAEVFADVLKKIDLPEFVKACNACADTFDRGSISAKNLDLLKRFFVPLHKEYVKTPEQILAEQKQKEHDDRETRIRELGLAALAKEEATSEQVSK